MNVFKVSTDYLLKDNITEPTPPQESAFERKQANVMENVALEEVLFWNIGADYILYYGDFSVRFSYFREWPETVSILTGF